MINPGNAVAIPWSWAALHFPAIMHARSAKSGGMTDQAISVYGSCLLNLTSGFCRIVTSLEKAIQYGFSFGRGRPVAYIRRRNMDFLATVALNLGSWQLPVRGVAEIITKIEAVSQSSTC